MKVLKPRKRWSATITCRGCGAVLLVEEKDLYSTVRESQEGTDYYVTFKCPQCGVESHRPAFNPNAAFGETE